MDNNRSFIADSGHITAVETSHARWETTLTFDVLNREEEKQLTAMLSQLRGIYETINIPAWTRQRADTGLGDIAITYAQQNDFTITVSATGGAEQTILYAGDYITISTSMFEVTQDVIADNNGIAIINLNRRLHRSSPRGRIINYLTPSCLMRLSEDSITISRRALFSSLSVSFIEAIL